MSSDWAEAHMQEVAGPKVPGFGPVGLIKIWFCEGILLKI